MATNPAEGRLLTAKAAGQGRIGGQSPTAEAPLVEELAGDAPISGKSRRSTPTKVRTRGGVRTMKMYSLTEGELGEIATLRGAATVAFSVGSACFGFWVSVTQGFAFSKDIDPVVEATWDTWRTASLVASVVLAVVGSYLLFRGHTRLNAIKREMEHDS